MLIRLGQDLVVQHFDDVILLNAGSGRRTIRNVIINDQSKTFGEAELLANNSGHIRSFDAEICDRHLGHSLVPLRWPACRGTAGLTWLTRRWRTIRLRVRKPS